MQSELKEQSKFFFSLRGLDAVLLLIFVFLFMLTTYSEPYGEVVYFINFFRFLLIGVYFFATFAHWKKIVNNRHFIKGAILLAVILLTIVSSVLMRAKLFEDSKGIAANYHDGAMQTEDAFALLLDGKNPYRENYYQLQLGAYAPEINFSHISFVNPALDHYIYLPATFIISGTLGAIEDVVLGMQDIRILTLLSLLAIAAVMYRTISHKELAFILVVCTLFSPILVPTFLEGRNDVIVLSMLALSFFSLLKKKYVLAGALFGLAIATKQFAWVFIPFVVTYFLSRAKSSLVTSSHVKRFAITTMIIAGLFVLPFFLWDPSAFIDDTLLYATGASGGLNYPINGFGFSMVLLLFGVAPQASFPFWIPILLLAGPVFFFMLRRVYREPTIANIILGTGLFLSVALFFSRFLNDNYITFISMIFFLWFAFSQVREEKRA